MMNLNIKFAPIFADELLNNELQSKVKNLYEQTVYKRIHREAAALSSWMAEFPTQPLPFKTSLQNQIESIENYPDKNSVVLEKLEKLKNQLNSGQYCEGNNEHAIYKGNYEDRRLAFVWPTEEEAAIRQQEESELLAQINK
jgi:hypothetical protein